ncbi:unnamed protein product [Caenorhabditis bovis]|uniref:Tetratricopeptide repeat protein 26 n=1 Tax=Caenorhabditis bovis TaxID=2654633 RepID=A0A8S1EQP2_9PELO|nr:unnamed protein product [Caenorhabditis bovis]
MPELEDFLLKKDYEAAISMLQFKESEGPYDETRSLWLGHCYVRSGEYRKAAQVYEKMMKQSNYPQEVPTYLGCCLFYLGMYNEAKQVAEKAPKSGLQVRLMFHVSHKLGDEKRLMTYHQQLGDNLEDQLSLASIHYMRMHYGAAAEIYKQLLVEHPNLLAINVYMAMCYFKMDYYDVAKNVLENYANVYPTSPAVQNLRSCINFRAYSAKAADVPEIEAMLKTDLYPSAKAIMQHNLVVFKNGDKALQVFPSLMDTVPEARLNMILYYLKKDQIQDALALCGEVEPQLPSEFLIKAITFTIWGYMKDSKDHLKTAEQFFKMVGQSTAEADTITGRHSMASTNFLANKHDEALVFLNTIEEYHQNDDVFHMNYAQSLLQCRHYKDAEENFLKVTGPDRDKPLYKFMLARAFIFNGKPNFAWDILTKTKDQSDAFHLMKIIAHDCYKASEFFYAAKAFDALERADPSPENWQGKRGATAGLFRQLVQGKATNDQMSEILALVDTSHHPHAEFLSNVIRKWAKSHAVALD